MPNLNDKVAVVLGASAEGGTGWAIAEALAAEGAKVVVAARSMPSLQKLADKIGGYAVKCDAASEEQVAALAEAAVAKYGKVDIAVNSAGLPVMSMIENSETEMIQAALNVNYLGQYYFTKYMAKAIDTDGSIIFISSMSVTHPLLPHFAYACAKAASDCLVRYAAVEYGPRQIRVNSILPGAIQSEMAREVFGDPRMVSVYEREIPLRRIGQPEDFANAVVWLAGPAYITGQNIQVNGGNALTRMPYLEELPGGADSYGDGKPLGDR